MAYRGFSGGGFVGNHLTTALLEALRPAADNAGRHATVGDPSTRAAPYTSDGESWKSVPLVSADGLSLVSGDGSFLYGPVTSGAWMKVPSIFRLRIAGTGTLQMDSKDSLGNITLLTFPLTTYTSETDKIEFPYAGDDAVLIRVTLTGTLTCEVI